MGVVVSSVLLLWVGVGLLLLLLGVGVGLLLLLLGVGVGVVGIVVGARVGLGVVRGRLVDVVGWGWVGGGCVGWGWGGGHCSLFCFSFFLLWWVGWWGCGVAVDGRGCLVRW